MVVKYRIFDNKYKSYCEDADFKWLISRNGKLYNSENDEWYIIGDRFLIEFNTGLKDKNGTDIYEGDIVNDGKGEIFYCDKSAMFKVRWHDNLYKTIRGKKGERLFQNCNITWEVVGNINTYEDFIWIGSLIDSDSNFYAPYMCKKSELKDNKLPYFSNIEDCKKWCNFNSGIIK